MTNRQRIHLAHVAILASDPAHRDNLYPGEGLVDLIANLWHYADYHGVDFHEVCDIAAMHHAEESEWGLDDIV